MTVQSDNKQALLDFFAHGCKGGDIGRVGVEIEHFIIDEDGEQVPYIEKHGRTGIADILKKLSEFWPDVIENDDGQIMGANRENSSITIEPSGQIELSIAPFLTVAEVQNEYESFLFRLHQIVDALGYQVVTSGYHPTTRAADLELIPKERYHFMDSYFAKIPGMHAERMMRATASLQVSLDYSDEADAVRKMRLATLLGPILSLITDNCPVYEAAENVEPLRRLRVWREVDPERCAVVPHLFEAGFGFSTYAEWLLATPPIFITRPYPHESGSQTSAEAYADAPMSTSDVLHVLGMFWPDVRLKNYVEIRQADSLPLAPAMGYVALVKGLFYGPASLELLEHAFNIDTGGLNSLMQAPAQDSSEDKGAPAWPYSADDVEAAIAAIVADGYDAHAYGRKAHDWIDLLFQLAPDGLGTEVEFLEALKDFKGF